MPRLANIALLLLLAFIFERSYAAEAPNLGAPASPPAKLAIITSTKDFAAHADLLTATLSGTAGITLVERDQIDKLLREQELSLAQGRDALKIGRLLNAEGVLLLERQTEATNEFLSVRLLAVTPGVVAGEHRFALPLTQPTELAKSYLPYLERLLPKLRVKPGEAIGISVLNLRASLPTASAMTLEQELTSLLRLRLAREPAVFLLERQRLKELAEEKETFVQAEPFWNSAFTLDGIINRDAIERGTVSIHAKVIPPRGETINLEVRGKRDSLGLVVNDLVEKLLSALKRSVAPSNWQSEAEAEKFFQEALWAYRWGNNQQVMEAADASWSLGLQTRAVAAHRIVARSRIAISARGSPTEYIRGYAFRPPPLPEALLSLTEALEIFRESFAGFSAPTNASDIAWASLGADLLLVVANVLDPYFRRVEFRAGVEGDLHRLRETAREVGNLLIFLRPIHWQRDLNGLPSVFPTPPRMWNGTFSHVLLGTGCIWLETPTETIATFRKLWDPAIYPLIREDLMTGPVPKIGWTARDRVEAFSTWMRFLRDMSAPTNAQVRIDRLRLILIHSADPDELTSTARQLFDEAWAERYQIYRRRLDAPVPIILTNVIKKVGNWGAPPVTTFQNLAADWSIRFAEAQPDFIYLDWRELIVALTNKTARSIAFSPPRGNLRTEQARALIAEVETYQREKQDRWGYAGRYIDALRKSLPSSTADQPLTSPRLSPAVQPTDWKFSTSLRISRIWDLSKIELLPDRSFGYSVGYRQRSRHMSWNNDRLWFETQTYRKGGHTRPALVALAPLTMTAEIFEAPYEDFIGIYDPKRSLIVGDDQFIAGPGGLWHHNASKGWQKPSTELGGLPVAAFRGNVILSGSDAVLELNPRTEEVRILASTRRNPPASALDRIGMPGEAISVWPGDRLCAVLNGSVWMYDTNRSDWRAVLSVTNCGESPELQSGGAIYRQFGNCGPPFVGGWRPGSSFLEFFTCGQVSKIPFDTCVLFHPAAMARSCGRSRD